MREESKSYARSGLTSINKMRIFRLVIRYESEVDRAGNALDMRSNLIVLGSRERSKEGIEWSVILVFVGTSSMSWN